MQFTQYENASQFERVARPFLNENEDVYSLFDGVLQGIKAGRYQNPLMATVNKGNQVLALIQMTPPHPLHLIISEEAQMEGILDFATKELFTRNFTISSVVGLKSVVNRYANKWQELSQCKIKVLMDQGVYRLDEVNRTLKKSSGTWRYATKEDISLIESWYQAFEMDTGLKISPLQIIKERVKQFLQDEEIFLWEDQEEVVSIMKKSRPTEQGITVSFVYTPKEHRKKGYARTMVAAGSEELLKHYKFCVLYTDMLNPTSNKIYQEIGYQKIADSVHVEFV